MSADPDRCGPLDLGEDVGHREAALESMTAEELAGELGVSRRTVCRDVEVLAQAGVRLESAHGRAGGYRIPRRERPEMLGLGAEATESEALA
ncbi:MAG TPA: HTH domain-containing protein [Solirubrobacterales bacterium]